MIYSIFGMKFSPDYWDSINNFPFHLSKRFFRSILPPWKPQLWPWWVGKWKQPNLCMVMACQESAWLQFVEGRKEVGNQDLTTMGGVPTPPEDQSGRQWTKRNNLSETRRDKRQEAEPQYNLKAAGLYSGMATKEISAWVARINSAPSNIGDGVSCRLAPFVA